MKRIESLIYIVFLTLFISSGLLAGELRELSKDEIQRLDIEIECVLKKDKPIAYFERKKYLVKKGSFMRNSYNSLHSTGEVTTGWEVIKSALLISGYEVNQFSGDKYQSYNLTITTHKQTKKGVHHHTKVTFHLDSQGTATIRTESASNYYTEESNEYVFLGASVNKVESFVNSEWACSNNKFS